MGITQCAFKVLSRDQNCCDSLLLAAEKPASPGELKKAEFENHTRLFAGVACTTRTQYMNNVDGSDVRGHEERQTHIFTWPKTVPPVLAA